MNEKAAKKFTAAAVFDEIPTLREKCSTEEIAIATISSWAKTKAGITRLEIYMSDKSKKVFDKEGRYKFTIPAKICKKFQLTK